MVQQLTNRIFPVDLSSFDVSTLTGTYQAVNGTGLSYGCFMIQFTNDSTSDVTISFDGVNDHEFIPGTADTISRNVMQINASNFSSHPVVFPKNTVIYVKGSAGTGNFYVSGYGQREVS